MFSAVLLIILYTCHDTYRDTDHMHIDMDTQSHFCKTKEQSRFEISISTNKFLL